MEDAARKRRPVGGPFRRWARRHAGGSFAVVEELFGPTRHEARIQQEEQRRVGRPAPTPTDPAPAVPGSGSRFKGKLTIPRPPQ